jgi:hypothetical protein
MDPRRVAYATAAKKALQAHKDWSDSLLTKDQYLSILSANLEGAKVEIEEMTAEFEKAQKNLDDALIAVFNAKMKKDPPVNTTNVEYTRDFMERRSKQIQQALFNATKRLEETQAIMQTVEAGPVCHPCRAVDVAAKGPAEPTKARSLFSRIMGSPEGGKRRSRRKISRKKSKTYKRS